MTKAQKQPGLQKTELSIPPWPVHSLPNRGVQGILSSHFFLGSLKSKGGSQLHRPNSIEWIVCSRVSSAALPPSQASVRDTVMSYFHTDPRIPVEMLGIHSTQTSFNKVTHPG